MHNILVLESHIPKDLISVLCNPAYESKHLQYVLSSVFGGPSPHSPLPCGRPL